MNSQEHVLEKRSFSKKNFHAADKACLQWKQDMLAFDRKINTEKYGGNDLNKTFSEIKLPSQNLKKYNFLNFEGSKIIPFLPHHLLENMNISPDSGKVNINGNFSIKNFLQIGRGYFNDPDPNLVIPEFINKIPGVEQTINSTSNFDVKRIMFQSQFDEIDCLSHNWKESAYPFFLKITESLNSYEIFLIEGKSNQMIFTYNRINSVVILEIYNENMYTEVVIDFDGDLPDVDIYDWLNILMKNIEKI